MVPLMLFKDHQRTENKPSYTIVNNGQGEIYEWQNDQITIRLNGKQTQDQFTLSEDMMKPNFKLGLHLHRKHPETFHILEGCRNAFR